MRSILAIGLALFSAVTIQAQEVSSLRPAEGKGTIGWDKGTIGIVCIDSQGLLHISTPHISGERTDFEVCIDEIVHTWEQNHSVPAARMGGVSAVDSVDVNELIRGYGTYREAMESATSRIYRKN